MVAQSTLSRLLQALMIDFVLHKPGGLDLG